MAKDNDINPTTTLDFNPAAGMSGRSGASEPNVLSVWLIERGECSDYEIRIFQTRCEAEQYIAHAYLKDDYSMRELKLSPWVAEKVAYSFKFTRDLAFVDEWASPYVSELPETAGVDANESTWLDGLDARHVVCEVWVDRGPRDTALELAKEAARTFWAANGVIESRKGPIQGS